jgi:hypothetical protein
LTPYSAERTRTGLYPTKSAHIDNALLRIKTVARADSPCCFLVKATGLQEREILQYKSPFLRSGIFGQIREIKVNQSEVLLSHFDLKLN